MTPEEKGASSNKTKKIIVIILIGVVILFISCAVFVTLTLVVKLLPVLTKDGGILSPKKEWKREADAGLAEWDSNAADGEAKVEYAIQMAEKDKASNLALFHLHRSFAKKLYNYDEFDKGDKENEKAIELEKNNRDPRFADELACAYQDLAWSSQHWRYLEDRTLPPGDKAQEASLDICRTLLPNTTPHAYKLATLAAIYADMGEAEKADKTIAEAIEMVKKPSAAGAASYVWMFDARSKAAEHKFIDAAQAYEKALESSAGNKEDSDRALSELLTGIREAGNVSPNLQAQKQAQKKSDLEQIPQLIASKNYKGLEALADKLREKRSVNADGSWILDSFYSKLEEKVTTDASYKERIQFLRDWLKSNPKSSVAHIALAGCYKNYGWFARGSGYANSVTASGGKLFEDRLAQARAILEEDADIAKKCPASLAEFEILSMGQGWSRKDHDEVIDKGHKLWPTYWNIDLLNCTYLLPRWYGGEHEWEKYANQRAGLLSGKDGDVLYARMVWHVHDYVQDDFFAEAPGIDWKRAKRGYLYIIQDYPKCMAAVRAYVNLASQAHDQAAIREILTKLGN